jgi:hypothetical protein
MKKIVRLTESDLSRIVRRIIEEQSSVPSPTKSVTNNGVKAFQTIRSGMEGLGTDEDKVQLGVFMIKNKVDYQTCLSYVKKEGYNTIMKYIATDMSYGKSYDKTTSSRVANWGQLDNNPYLIKFEKHLQQFNPNEKIQM